jgi:hypothetical protein
MGSALSQLGEQKSAARARKQQDIEEQKQAQEARRRQADQQYRQRRTRVASSDFTGFWGIAQADRIAPSVRDSASKPRLSHAIRQSAAGRPIETAATPALTENSDHAPNQSQNMLVRQADSDAAVRLPSDTQYDSSTGKFSMPVKVTILHEAVSGRLSGQIDGNAVVYIPPPDRSNAAIPGASAERRPTQREIPAVVGIDNTHQTIAVSLQQGRQQLGLGARWRDIKEQRLYFDDQNGEKRVTISPPKAPVGSKNADGSGV